MKIKHFRRTQFAAVLSAAGKVHAYAHGATSDTTGPEVLSEMTKLIERGGEAPKLTLDTDRGDYTLRYHPNRFYYWKAA